MSERIDVKCWCGGLVHWDTVNKTYRCQYGHNIPLANMPPHLNLPNPGGR